MVLEIIIPRDGQRPFTLAPKAERRAGDSGQSNILLDFIACPSRGIIKHQTNERFFSNADNQNCFVRNRRALVCLEVGSYHFFAKMTHDEWLLSLKSDKGTLQWFEENKDKLTPEERLMAEILRHIERTGQAPPIVHGAYGPEEDKKSDAYVEKIEFPKEGGAFMKYYGCPFKVKGLSPVMTVRAMQHPKYFFSYVPREIWRFSKLTAFALGIIWLIGRKGLLRFLDEYLTGIVEKRTIHNFTQMRDMLPFFESVGHEGVAWLRGAIASADANNRIMYWPESWYNQCEAEIYRCMIESAKGEGIYEGIFTKLAKFFRLFLFIDNTYRHRVQDALSENKDLFGTLDVLSSRELGSPTGTWRMVKYVLKFILLTSPALKRITDKFFKNLDREKCKMDEDDWYFACTYKSYQMKGMPYDERKKYREEMNKKHGVVFI